MDPVARVRFPPKSWEFFQPNLQCFVLCYGFHVVRILIAHDTVYASVGEGAWVEGEGEE